MVGSLTRQRMTSRCTVERNQATTVDGYNNPSEPVWAPHLTNLACYYWEPTATARYIGEQTGPRNADLYVPKLLLPAGTDVTEEDRINGITDRRGQTISARVFNITQVVRKPDHVLAVLEVVES